MLKVVVGVALSFVMGMALTCSLAVMVAGAFGYRFLAVESGSMAPAIPQGSIVLASPHDAGELAAGDVVVFTPPGWREPVVHRVVELWRDGDGVELRTRGDANNAADSWGRIQLRGEQMHVVVAAVPMAGGVLAWVWAGALHGWLWAGVLAVLAARWVWRHRRPRDGVTS